MQWPNATISSATDKASHGEWSSGVKMTGPYDYVSPPIGWWIQSTGAPMDITRKPALGRRFPRWKPPRFLPAKDLWPLNNVWHYHARGDDSIILKQFNDGMRTTYGWPDSTEEYSRIAQTMTYDGERAMFEA